MKVRLLLSALCTVFLALNSNNPRANINFHDKSLQEIATILSPGVLLAHHQEESHNLLKHITLLSEYFELPRAFELMQDALVQEVNVFPKLLLEQCVVALFFLPNSDCLKKDCPFDQHEDEVCEHVRLLLHDLEDIAHDDKREVSQVQFFEKALVHPMFFMRVVECLSRASITVNSAAVVKVHDGTAGAPTYTFTGDLDTGMYHHTNGDTIAWATNGAEAMTLDATGDLDVVGTLTKGGGTFKINHPILPSKKLFHSFVEAPRADLIYRGEVQLQAGIAAVDIDDVVGMSSGTFEALSRKP